MKGFYHVQMAKFRVQSGDIEGANDHYLKCGDFYLQAADKLPDDDEEHACKFKVKYDIFNDPHIAVGFLNCAVENHFRCGSKPLRETLPILARIRLLIPKIKRIWGLSAMSKQGRDQILDQATMMEKEALEMIEKGKFTLDDCMMPEWRI